MSLEIGPNAWPKFEEIFVYYNECGIIGFSYKINGSYYDASSLIKEEDIDDNSYHSGFDMIKSSTINLSGSEILFINISGEGLLYQQLPSGAFVELWPLLEEDRIKG